MHLFHRLHHGTTHDLLAAEEQMLLHVDTNAGRSVAMRPNVAARLHALRDAHAALPRPAEAGRSIGIPVYRLRFLRHLVAPYAARAAVGSCSARIAAGGRKPCRSMSQVAL